MLKRLFILSTLWFIATHSMGEQKVEFSGHELHYIVLNTTEIAPEIAALYDITRSGKRAFINLSVLEQSQNGFGTPVPVTITAIERTLVGQTLNIELTEIREGQAIYYIGSFPIFDQETLWFDVNLTLEDGTQFEYTFDAKVWRE